MGMRAGERSLSARFAGVILLLLCVLLPLRAQDTILGQLLVARNAALDGIPAINATIVFSPPDLVTGPQGASQLATVTGDQVNFGPETKARLDRQKDRVRLSLRSGRIEVRGSTTEVKCLCLHIFSASRKQAVWEVAIVEDNTAEISVVAGEINIQAPDHTILVSPGQRVIVRAKPNCNLRRFLGLPTRGAGASALVVPLALADRGRQPVSPSGL